MFLFTIQSNMVASATVHTRSPITYHGFNISNTWSNKTKSSVIDFPKQLIKQALIFIFFFFLVISPHPTLPTNEPLTSHHNSHTKLLLSNHNPTIRLPNSKPLNKMDQHNNSPTLNKLQRRHNGPSHSPQRQIRTNIRLRFLLQRKLPNLPLRNLHCSDKQCFHDHTCRIPTSCLVGQWSKTG